MLSNAEMDFVLNDYAGTTVASSMMDKSGRRTLLMGSYTGMVRIHFSFYRLN